MKDLISEATRRNWKRLDVKKYEDKLKTRANKRRSKKTFIPVEYIRNKKNIEIIEIIVELIKDNDLNIKDSLVTLGIKLLKESNIDKKNTEVKSFIKDHRKNIIEDLLTIDIPRDEFDILGLIYQSLQEEGTKNIKGSYYTPEDTNQILLKDISPKEGETILDPCCGSGSFLLSLEVTDPNQLYGSDNDEIALILAKINLFLKYPLEGFKPNLYHRDFLLDFSGEQKFDYITTNPPWGALNKEEYLDLSYSDLTDESFCMFLLKSLDLLKEDGLLVFLLPESFTNVDKHSDVRSYILENFSIEELHLLDRIFKDVLTKCIGIRISKSRKNNTYINFYKEGRLLRVNSKNFYYTDSVNILPISDMEGVILNKAFKGDYHVLDESIWALGIVTGDNKNKLSDRPKKNWEPIYTGKEIKPYKLAKPMKYIYYDRDNFQQVARDSIYRAEEKLVYKFISKSLVFAYDDTASLFLNSSNILIPNIPGMTIKTSLAFLNSKLMSFIYKSIFGEVKILKGNLKELPFKTISSEDDRAIESLVNKLLSGKLNEEDLLKTKRLIDRKIYEIYGLSKEEVIHIEKYLKK